MMQARQMFNAMRRDFNTAGEQSLHGHEYIRRRSEPVASARQSMHSALLACSQMLTLQFIAYTSDGLSYV
jgi:hypothetical protein